MSSDESFRQEIRAWVEKNAPSSLRGTRRGRFDGYWGGRNARPEPDVKRWFDVALERGLTAPAWSKEYGGAGLSDAQARIVDQELARLELPPPLVGVGLTMIGPTLFDYGTPAQQREHLPRIVRGEVRWCQGYSEPGAGSDLASLSTKAVRDGDHFIVNGQKVWTSFADKSDWIFALVRTDPSAKKQLGITFLLIDMATPGVSTRPIELISGASPFCETFFEDVRVPVENVIGEVNAGWTVAKALLGYERSMIGEAMSGDIANAEVELVARARAALAAPSGSLPDEAIRLAIARTAMQERCFAFTIERLRQSARAGKAPGSESSILKIVASELKQTRWDQAVRIAGPAALGWEGAGFEARDLAATREWLRSRANTIEGGTSEVQLNIIAKHVLGLG
ncbi:MAG TPA: acyl-CoA dehydrogenase family protein [Polyangiales bacterium]|nr:acyl-CoA dehydrogenase family protein [Polyangiales bacterium]